MEVHRPKHPIRGFRDFLKEVGIIVLGVVIALAAEQTVEWLHWRSEIADTREALGREIGYDVGALHLIMVQDSCITQRLGDLEAWAATDARSLSPQRTPVLYAFQTSAWDVANSGGVVAHFPLDDQLRYAQMYARLANEREAIAEERATWARVVAVASERHPDATDLRELREAIGLARVAQARRESNQVNILRAAAPLAVQGPGPETHRGVNDPSDFCSAAPTSAVPAARQGGR